VLLVLNACTLANMLQISSLYAGGVDLFLVEFVCGTLESKAVITALEQWSKNIEAPLPVIIVGTLTNSNSRGVRVGVA
jgi:methionine synthase I (cobalamin-dependent)